MSASPPAAPSAPAVPWRAVLLFTVVAFGLVWLIALPLWLLPSPSPVLWSVLTMVMMFSPAIAALVVMRILRVPGAPRARALGLWPLGRPGRFIGFAAIAVFGPILVVLLVVAVSAALGLVHLDLVGFSGFAAMMEAQGAPAGELPPVGLLVALQLALLPVAAILPNSIVAFGEELGWRGWLQPALGPLGTWPALLITGVVWGLWHSPVILLGYNFERPDLSGVLFMVTGCIAWGILLGWLRIASDSLWPAVFAHGSLNAVAGVVLVLVAAGETPDQGIVGPLGVVSWAVIAVIVVIMVACGAFRPRRDAPAMFNP